MAAAFSEGFVQLLEAAPDAMLVVGADGRIRIANGQAETLFGHTRDALVGAPIETLLPARFRERHVGHRESYAKQPRVRPMGAGLELFGLQRDGHEFPVEISLSPLRLADESFIIAAVRDVTERKAAEAEARRHLVARQIVRRILRQLSERDQGTGQSRRALGRNLATDLPKADVAAYLDAFDAMGVGTLRRVALDGARHEFEGNSLIEVTGGHATPTCHIALGFLEGVVSGVSGRSALGSEVRCQSQGHAACLFVIMAK